ncbi:MAG: PP2C family protein-serine/threonine phosphatase [Hyphomicrobium sp.]
MNTLPPDVAERLQILTAEDKAVAYLHIGADLAVLDAGGHLANYGLHEVLRERPVVEQVYFLEGLLPLEVTPYVVPSVEFETGRVADVHMHQSGSTTWVLFLDTTADRDARRKLQQKAYEMTLLEEKQAQLNRKLEATNASLVLTQRELEISRDAIREELARKQFELAEARSLQLSLLPPSFREQTDQGTVTVHCILEPAKEVGGDITDYFLIADDLVVIVLGDVSGKGAGAALFMARTHALFRGLSARPDAEKIFRSPETAVSLVNRALAMGNDSCTFVTLLLAVYDKSCRTLDYVRAGHLPPILMRTGCGAMELHDPGGLPIGLSQEARYAPVRIELKPGDNFLVVTDGITEAVDPSGIQFGDERLVALLSASSAWDGRQLLNDLFARVRSYENDLPPGDDKAAVVLGLRP